jgi:hypothetical protein
MAAARLSVQRMVIAVPGDRFGNRDGGHMHTTLVAARVGTAGSEGDVLHLKYVCCGLGRWEEKPTGLGC